PLRTHEVSRRNERRELRYAADVDHRPRARPQAGTARVVPRAARYHQGLYKGYFLGIHDFGDGARSREGHYLKAPSLRGLSRLKRTDQQVPPADDDSRRSGSPGSD